MKSVLDQHHFDVSDFTGEKSGRQIQRQVTGGSGAGCVGHGESDGEAAEPTSPSVSQTPWEEHGHQQTNKLSGEVGSSRTESQTAGDRPKTMVGTIIKQKLLDISDSNESRVQSPSYSLEDERVCNDLFVNYFCICFVFKDLKERVLSRLSSIKESRQPSNYQVFTSLFSQLTVEFHLVC